MRIRIDDDFDNDFEKEYRNVDSDSIIGNGNLGRDNSIIDVNANEVKDKESYIENQNYEIKSMPQKHSNNGFRVELQGGIFIEDNYEENQEIKIDNLNKEQPKKEKKYYSKNDVVRENETLGKITVISRLGDKKGTVISDAKINLYMLNGISPKLVSSKVTDENGLVVFENLKKGSYRVIAIVNRKYFEKPTYIKWNEVTISEELTEETIVVINKIKISNIKR